MKNPYEPPKAAVGDVGEPPLPLAVRTLRSLAITGSAFLGVVTLLYPFFGSGGMRLVAFLLAVSVVLLLAGTSIAALVSRIAERPMRWGAMLVNALVIGLIGWAFYPNVGGVGLIVIVPALLNLLAIELLRRARARLAS